MDKKYAWSMQYREIPTFCAGLCFFSPRRYEPAKDYGDPNIYSIVITSPHIKKDPEVVEQLAKEMLKEAARDARRFILLTDNINTSRERVDTIDIINYLKDKVTEARDENRDCNIVNDIIIEQFYVSETFENYNSGQQVLVCSIVIDYLRDEDDYEEDEDD